VRSSFAVAFRVLPPERRRAIRAVYGFCRSADDAVDTAADRASARGALHRVAERLDRAYADGTEGDGEKDLRRAIRRFDLPRRPFEDLIEGVSWDIDARRYADTLELRDYCYRVASTVGLLCVRIFGCRDGVGDAYARELGVALQWTNILRDVAQDLEQGRVYLPLRSLQRHRLTEQQLSDPDAGARRRVTALIREEARYARLCFDAARRALPRTERPKVLAAEIMAGVYGSLLRRIERAGDGVLDRRIRVPTPVRGWIASRLLLCHRLRWGSAP
jgi:phytoene synthase